MKVSDKVVGYHISKLYNKVDLVTQDKRFDVLLKHYKDIEGEEQASNLAQEEDWKKTELEKATLKLRAPNMQDVSNGYEYMFED